MPCNYCNQEPFYEALYRRFTPYGGIARPDRFRIYCLWRAGWNPARETKKLKDFLEYLNNFCNFTNENNKS